MNIIRVAQFVVRKHTQFPQRGNFARIRDSLTSPLGRCAMPIHPYSRFPPPHNWATEFGNMNSCSTDLGMISMRIKQDVFHSIARSLSKWDGSDVGC
jgi:hypothetical protein